MTTNVGVHTTTNLGIGVTHVHARMRAMRARDPCLLNRSAISDSRLLIYELSSHTKTTYRTVLVGCFKYVWHFRVYLDPGIQGIASGASIFYDFECGFT